MDDPQPEPESNTQTTLDEDASSRDGHTSGLFSRSKQFRVSGGTFTNVTNIQRIAPSNPPDFRVIPLGDLNLLHEIDRGCAVVRGSRRGRASVKRIYTAHIPALQSRMTAAVYQGDGAEEEWREEILRYSNLRHPYLVQLYGVVKTRNLHAAIFHDDLAPVDELKNSVLGR
ncbi:hypothetical protein C8R47DRAFT_6850 [Mycena vitilis]|nr:hypothetical protein C8R47DRAFT_6850 [Mycena vitilis]